MSKLYALSLDRLNKCATDFSAEQRDRKAAAAGQQHETPVNDLAKTISDLIDENFELRDACLDTIHRLVLAAEYKDEDTASHTTRIGRYSALMAAKIGLSRETIQNIFHASHMHDIGKISVPDSILLKRGKVNEREFDIIKTHTTVGADILADAKTEILQIAQIIAVSHHENWDGSGYPECLAGEHIPLAGRIVKLVDVFDALTSSRPYKGPYPVEMACDIIRRERGKQFDPVLVDTFIASINEIIKIREEVA